MHTHTHTDTFMHTCKMEQYSYTMKYSKGIPDIFNRSNVYILNVLLRSIVSFYILLNNFKVLLFNCVSKGESVCAYRRAYICKYICI